MSEVLLEVKNAGCSKGPSGPIFSNVNFTVNAGDIMVIQGKSGSGKSTLLKSLAHLNLYDGELLYRGRTPKSYGIPSFRTRVMYVPQRASLLPGTPREFMEAISTFGSYNSKSTWSVLRGGKPAISQEPIEIADSWGIDEDLWDRAWSNLSGGEMQRIALAIAVGMKTAEILLLDEPTSALDADTSASVEAYLKNELREPETNLKALIWITHSEEQGRRVGTRFMRITAGTIQEETDGGV
ncbi:P-loop containing nucleoside triphosphate hydrolase protein [Amylocystis lapponica]|nr:P-loop containing nucleoside triphosphate hydrolase protein [Amylocystis lapponica]